MNNKRYLIIIGALFIACLCVLKIQQAKGMSVSKISVDNLPLVIGDWRGENVPVPADVYEILATKNVLMRRYKNGEDNVLYLAVVYSENNPDSIHPPEICYLGGGAEFLERGMEKIILKNKETMVVNELQLKTASGIVYSWHWFVVGNKRISNYYHQQVMLILNALRGKENKGALIRVSIEGNRENSEKQAFSFINEAVPLLEKIFN